MTGRGHRRRRPGKATSGIFLFLVLCSLWLLWSWNLSFHHPLLLGFGLASAIGVTLLSWRMGILGPETIPLHLFFRILRYLPWLAVEVVKSCIDVLRRSLTWPEPNIDPVVDHINTRQRSDLGLVTLANSITLTPGTISLGTDPEKGLVTVHGINREAVEELKRGEMDRRVLRIESRGK